MSTPSIPPAAGTALAIVRVASPWYAPDALITRIFRRSIGDYEPIHELQRKLYTLSEDRRYGGIYLWSGMARMQAHFSPEWAQRVRERRGSDPNVRLWHAPFVLAGPSALRGRPVGARSFYEAHAAATLTLFPRPQADAAPARLAELYDALDGLAWAAVLCSEAGHIGMLHVWSAEASADGLTSSRWLTQAQREFGSAAHERYRVPVWMGPG